MEYENPMGKCILCYSLFDELFDCICLFRNNQYVIDICFPCFEKNKKYLEQINSSSGNPKFNIKSDQFCEIIKNKIQEQICRFEIKIKNYEEKLQKLQ